MCLNGYTCLFDGFYVNCFLNFAPFLPPLDLALLLYVNRDGGDNRIGPRPLLKLSKIEKHAEKFMKPHYGIIWENLVGFEDAEKVNISVASSLNNFSLR